MASFIDPPLAFLLKSRLEFEGIVAWVADDHHINLQWTISLALGGVKVKVMEADREDAQKVLYSDCAEALDAISFPGDVEAACCEKCGSMDLKRYSLTRKAAALTLLTGLPFIYFGKRVKCRDCGHVMKT